MGEREINFGKENRVNRGGFTRFFNDVFVLFAYEMEVAAEAFEGGFVQFFLMVRVGNGNQGLGTVLHGFAVKVYRTEFGDYIVDVETGGNDSGTV